MSDPLACYIDDSGFFMILSKTELNSVLAYVAFCLGKEVGLNQFGLEYAFFLYCCDIVEVIGMIDNRGHDRKPESGA